MNEKELQNLFLELLEPVRKPLSNYAWAITKNRHDAQDLVSETILIAYTNFSNLKKKESFKSYLFSIASRLFRRWNKRKKIFGFYDESKAELIKDNTNQELSYDVEVLYEKLKLLPEKQSEAIILFEISGLSIEEIKKIQGGTISGVKSRLKRGRESLTILFNDKKYDENEYLENEIRTEKVLQLNNGYH